MSGIMESLLKGINRKGFAAVDQFRVEAAKSGLWSRMVSTK